MTGSMFVVLVVVLAGIFYLLLRRRGSRHGEAMKPLRPAEVQRGVMDSPDLKPFRPAAAAEKAGIPPRPKSAGLDSGSSHPAYPVAPAKYAGAPVLKTDQGSSQQSSAEQNTRSRQVPSAEVRKKAAAATAGTNETVPPPAEPWYPEAPASYTDDEEAGRGPSSRSAEAEH